MPLTFLAHQVPVLPLKLRWPRHVDGTALVIGSMAPDLLFALHGTGAGLDAHEVAAQPLLIAPLTIVLTILTKRVIAGVLAPHLPQGGRLRLRSYARLSAWTVPRTAGRWAVLISSALVGCYSHLVLDSFTHTWGYGAELLGLADVQVSLAWIGAGPRYLVDLFQIVGSAVGIVVAVQLLRRIGDRRLLESAYPAAPQLEPTAASRRTLLGITTLAAVAGLIAGVVPLLDAGGHDVLFRVVDSTFVGLVVGSALARRQMRAVPALAVADDDGEPAVARVLVRSGSPLTD